MNKLDEIALLVAGKIDDGSGEQYFVDQDGWITEFAHALLADPELLAELSKDAEPVGFVAHGSTVPKNARTFEGRSIMSKDDADEYIPECITPLFTRPIPANTAEIEPALKRYNAHMEGELEPEPIERLRFFLSLALTGQNWLDVEQFIDALPKQAEIEQLVAEAIAKMVDIYGGVHCAEEIRKELWREYL